MTKIEIIQELKKLAPKEIEEIIKNVKSPDESGLDQTLKAVYIKGDILEKAEKFAKTPADNKKFEKLCKDIKDLWGDENINSSLSQEELDANSY